MNNNTASWMQAPNMTLLNQKIQGYNPTLDNSKIDFKVWDNTQFGEIVVINKLFGYVSCMIGNKWYNERDLIPCAKVVKIEKVNFVVGFVMSLIK